MRNSKFSKSRRSKTEPLDLDITSLLDILVILLVFLLKSFNASDLKIDLAKDLNLPNSQSSKLGNHGIIIQVNKDGKVVINHKRLGMIDFNESGNIKIIEDYFKENQEYNKELFTVNFVFDEDIPYSVINRVMQTSKKDKQTKYKFIVKSE